MDSPIRIHTKMSRIRNTGSSCSLPLLTIYVKLLMYIRVCRSTVHMELKQAETGALLAILLDLGLFPPLLVPKNGGNVDLLSSCLDFLLYVWPLFPSKDGVEPIPMRASKACFIHLSAVYLFLEYLTLNPLMFLERVPSFLRLCDYVFLIFLIFLFYS
jgi:hypothetical protein